MMYMEIRLYQNGDGFWPLSPLLAFSDRGNWVVGRLTALLGPLCYSGERIDPR